MNKLQYFLFKIKIHSVWRLELFFVLIMNRVRQNVLNDKSSK